MCNNNILFQLRRTILSMARRTWHGRRPQRHQVLSIYTHVPMGWRIVCLNWSLYFNKGLQYLSVHPSWNIYLHLYSYFNSINQYIKMPKPPIIFTDIFIRISNDVLIGVLIDDVYSRVHSFVFMDVFITITFHVSNTLINI